MNATIMKFGGTSVEGATAFKNAARIVIDRQALRPVVVVSAMAGFTDALLDSARRALQPDGAGDAKQAIESLEKHFDRHLRVIDSLLTKESSRMISLVDRSRAELTELLHSAAEEVGWSGTSAAQAVSDGNNGVKGRKFFADAIVSHGERLSAAMLAAVLSENGVVSQDVDARRR
jgi:aspartate kinase